MDTEGLAHLLTRVQDGVVSRRQLTDLGARPHDVRRMLRRRDLTRVHSGVYVDHTGPLTWEQRAWAAVLVHWPAALTRESALPSPPRGAPIQVAIGLGRQVTPVRGVAAHRTAVLESRLVPHSAPPRVALEHAVIDVAASRGDLVDRFRVLADVIQTRRTDAARIAAVLRTRRGVAHRAELLDLLLDLEVGACSVLEREYLLLERRHGLSSSAVTRQVADHVRGARIYRDVEHLGLGLVIELDGRAFHDTAAARDRDAGRDLASLVDGDRTTLRITYGLVVRDGCRTITAIATLLTRRGWTGAITPCPACPPVDVRPGATQ